MGRPRSSSGDSRECGAERKLQVGSDAPAAATQRPRRDPRFQLVAPASESTASRSLASSAEVIGDPVDEALRVALNRESFEKLGGGRYRFRGQRVFCRLDQEGRLLVRKGSEFVPIGDFLQQPLACPDRAV